MSSFKLRALSSWKKINVKVATENPDLEGFGFGGLEVLDDYEILPLQKSSKKSDREQQQQEKKKKKQSFRSGNSDNLSKGRDIGNKVYNGGGVENFKGDNAISGKKDPIDDDHNHEDRHHDQDFLQKQCDGDEAVIPPTTTSGKKRNSKHNKQQNGLVQLANGKRPKRKQETQIATGGEVKRRKGQDGKQTSDMITETQDAQGPAVEVNVKGMEGWKGLFVPLPVLKALKELGFTAPTLIQALTLPSAIRDRQDILGAAETGSGKTLAFGIPVIEKAINWKKDTQGQAGVCALILTPTRELCIQVRDHLTKAAMYTDLKVVAVMGGLALHKQLRLLKAKPEIVVATPGRLWDIMNGEQEEAGSYLSSVVKAPMLVIDEADKMVEKGHFEELTKILTLMKGDEGSRWKRQSFVFSATLTYVHLPPDRLSKKKKKRKRSKGFQISKESKLDDLIETVGILKKPKVVDITQKSQTASQLVESCIFCTHTEKDLYLYYFLQRHPGRTLIFTNSVDCIRRLVSLFSLLKKSLLPLHANMVQKQRLKNLEKFAANDTAVLVATDVAARGLDIPNVQHVIHYQIPRTSESYVHRSGRTARALKDGLSIMVVDEKEISNYRKIVKSLEKDDDLSTFPVDQSGLRLLKPVVSLAQRIDSTQHRMVKVKREEDWFTKMAKEADLGSSDDAGSDLDQEEVQREDLKAKRKLENMKSELADILAEGAFKTHSYRGKYPTTGGKLEMPKNLNSKKETQAITLVSRKRRV